MACLTFPPFDNKFSRIVIGYSVYRVCRCFQDAPVSEALVESGFELSFAMLKNRSPALSLTRASAPLLISSLFLWTIVLFVAASTKEAGVRVLFSNFFPTFPSDSTEGSVSGEVPCLLLFQVFWFPEIGCSQLPSTVPVCFRSIPGSVVPVWLTFEVRSWFMKY